MEPINYTVLRIDGDYAVLTTGKGDENPVAMALLPPGITEGDHIHLLEINTTPGMTATSFIPQQVRAAGLDIKDVMTEIIEDTLASVK